MTTLAGSAHSTNTNTIVATRDVISKASARLNGRTPSLAVVFATPEHPLDKVLGQLKTSLGCPALGCTSGGPLTDQGASMGPGLALLLIAADDWVVDLAMAQGLNASPGQATRKLCAGYGRAAETAAQAVRRISDGGSRIPELIRGRQVALAINTITGGNERIRESGELHDGMLIRRSAVESGVPCFTSLDTARVVVEMLAAPAEYELRPVGEYRQGRPAVASAKESP